MADRAKELNKTAMVISSQVIRGAVGNRVNVFMLERLGFGVWAMPTVIMPWQPRQGESHKMAVPAADFTAWAEEIAASDKSAEIDAVISGYFAAPYQVRQTAALIHALKAKKPGLVFLCDPIMGNEHGPYVPPAVMEAVINELVPLADLVKPNRNELEWICGEKFHSNAEIIAAVKKRFAGKPFFVSSAFSDEKGDFGNLYYDGREAWLAEHPAAATPLNGFGDVIAAILLRLYMAGAKPADIAGKTAAAVYAYLRWTMQTGSDELALSTAPVDPAAPQAPVKLRQLA